MVNSNADNLDTIFSALSDATRRAMLRRLAGGEMTVAELAQPFAITKPAITKHLKVLEKAGLLRRQIVGRTHRCRLAAQPLSAAAEWITFYEGFWNRKLDALDAFLSRDESSQGPDND